MSEYDSTAMASAYDELAVGRAAAPIKGWKIEELDRFLSRLPANRRVD